MEPQIRRNPVPSGLSVLGYIIFGIHELILDDRPNVRGHLISHACGEELNKLIVLIIFVFKPGRKAESR